MEQKAKTPEEITSEIINKSAQKSQELLNTKLESSLTLVKKELTEKFEAKIVDLTTKLESATAENAGLQKSIDELKTSNEELKENSWVAKDGNEVKSFYDYVKATMEEKKEEIQALSRGKIDRVSLGEIKLDDQKSVTISAPVRSGVARELRIPMISDDAPNFLYPILSHVPTENTSVDGGSIRHTFLKHRPNQGTTGRFGAGSVAGRTTGNPGTDFSTLGYITQGEALESLKFDFEEHLTPIVESGFNLKVPVNTLNDVLGLRDFLPTKALKEYYDWNSRELLNGSGAAGQLRGVNRYGFKYTATGNAAAQQTAIEDLYRAELGSLGGIFAHGSTHVNYFDILNAARVILAKRNYLPNKIFLAVDDYGIFNITKSQVTAQYINQFGVSNAFKMLDPINNLQVIPTNAQPSGTFTILDTNCVKYFIREPLSLEIGRSGRDLETKNITLVLFHRSALVGYTESGILSESFLTIRNAINAKSGTNPTGLAGLPNVTIRTST